MTKIIKNVAVFGVLLALSMSINSAVSSAKETVKLPANKPWANSDPVKCQQASYEGSVSIASVKSVAWVLEYKGVDGNWHYQKRPEKWKYYSKGVSVPVINGKTYSRCQQRLQLNPKGEGEKGLGGIATGYLYIVPGKK